MNSFFNYLEQKNLQGHSKLIPTEEAAEAEDQASSPKSRKQRGTAAATQSQIIYKKQQNSELVRDRVIKPKVMDFGESSLGIQEEQEEEEEIKVSQAASC